MGLTFSPSAQARPSGYSTATCNTGGTTDICAMQSSTEWRCDLRRSGETQAGTITVIYAGSTENICDGEDYCAFGTDGGNHLFYCDVTDSNIEQVWVIGTDYSANNTGDEIWLYHDENSTHYDLDTHSTGSLVKGVVLARAGDDTIEGSYVNALDYKEDLHGDDDDDIIYGYNGGDLLTGDAGYDTLDGGAGNDTLYGGDGEDIIDGGDGNDIVFSGGDDDTVTGGNGNDNIHGDAGADAIAGNAGDDNIDGGAGADTMCGDAGIDHLDGADGDDTLWLGTAPSSSETNDGTDHPSRQCDVTVGGPEGPDWSRGVCETGSARG